MRDRIAVPVKIINNSQLFTITFKTPVPLQSTIDRLKSLDIVEYAHEPITIMYYDEPNDPYFHDDNNEVRWYFEAIQAIDAWGITHGSSEVVIGIIDNAFNPNHPDLLSKIQSHDGKLDLPQKSTYHGTRVASVAGGATGNSIGIASLGWQTSLRFYSCGDRIGLDDNIPLLVERISNAAQKCDIINMSWETAMGKPSVPHNYPEVEDEISNAISSGVVCIASAGNNRCEATLPPWVSYPAAHSGVIAVTATTINESGYETFKTGWNFGDYIDITAPGVGIVVANGDSGYIISLGTSYSAPMVSALASLIIALDPYENVENIIKSTADKIDSVSYPYINGWNNHLGYGRINAYKALKACFPNKPVNFRLTGSVGSHPTLLWSANTEPDLKGYKIYRKIGEEPEYCLVNLNKDYTSYTDPGIQIGTRFDPLVKYRMSAYDLANNESEKTNYVTTSAGGINKPVAEQTIEPLPTTFAVHPAYPNPFNSRVVIDYELPQESLVRTEVYDILGRLIWESNQEILPARYYQFYWDSQSSQQSLVSSGIYSFVILINNQPFVQKAVYIK